MRGAYRVLALLIPVLVAVQAAAIAVNAFGMFPWVDGGQSITKGVALVALLLLIASFFARVPGGVLAALLVLVATVVHVVLGFVAFGTPEVGALHGLNAFVLFGLAMLAAQKAKTGPARAGTSPHGRPATV